MNQTITKSMNFSETANDQVAKFPDIDYPNFVNSTIDGIILFNGTSETTPIEMNLTCMALNKTKQPIILSTTSNNEGKFNFTFSPLA